MTVSSHDILTVIPEFSMIVDCGLREKSLAVWAQELERYGYSATDLEDMPFTTLIENNPTSLAVHMRSLARQVYSCAELMEDDYGKNLLLNKDYLVAAALLHDIGKVGGVKKVGGKFLESEREKLLHHSFSGTGILLSAGFPDEVVHAVAVHSRDGEGRRMTPEAIVLHHVDFMNYEALELVK